MQRYSELVQNLTTNIAFARHSRESGNPVSLYFSKLKTLDSRFRGNDERNFQRTKILNRLSGVHDALVCRADPLGDRATGIAAIFDCGHRQHFVCGTAEEYLVCAQRFSHCDFAYHSADAE